MPHVPVAPAAERAEQARTISEQGISDAVPRSRRLGAAAACRRLWAAATVAAGTLFLRASGAAAHPGRQHYHDGDRVVLGYRPPVTGNPDGDGARPGYSPSTTGSGHEGDLAGCPLPTEMADLCLDPKMLLPMWRWTWVNGLWSDWGGWWAFSQIKAAIGSMYDLIVRILFVLSSLVWYLLSRLLYLVLSADFAGAVAKSINSNYKRIADALINSGVVATVAVIALLMGAWALYRNNTALAVRRILTSWVMLGLVFTMLWPLQDLPANQLIVDTSGATDEDSRLEIVRAKAASQRGTPLWLYGLVLDISDEASEALTSVSLGLTSDNNNASHASYCSVYTEQLEKLYLSTVEWRHGTLTAKHYTPIFLSRLWERAYLGPWSRAQYGSPQTALNGSCLWAEAKAGHVSAPEIMAIWSSTCEGSTLGASDDPIVQNWGVGVALYGCPGHTTDAAAAIPVARAGRSYLPAQQDRAWRVFQPDGDTETLTFLNLASGCSLATPPTEDDEVPSLQANSEGSPNVPEPDFPVLHGDGSGTLYVRGTHAYINATRIGMRPDKAEERGEWFSLDLCHLWLTGTRVNSGLDKRSGDSVGTYSSGPNDGQHQGLNSEFLQHRGAIGCADAERSAEVVVENLGQHQWRQATDADNAYQAAADICTFAGGRFFDRILNGVVVLLVAFSFAFSLFGMAVGTALAQILLVIVFMCLPVVLVASAIPTRLTRGLLPQTLKVALFASIAHAVFLLILTAMVFLIDILIAAVAEATTPGSFLRVMLLAVIPFLVKKVIAGFGKRLNMDFTSMKGGMRVTSGIAASGFGQDRSRMSDQLRYYGHSAVHGMMYGGMRGRGGVNVGERGMALSPGRGGAAGAVPTRTGPRPSAGTQALDSAKASGSVLGGAAGMTVSNRRGSGPGKGSAGRRPDRGSPGGPRAGGPAAAGPDRRPRQAAPTGGVLLDRGSSDPGTARDWPSGGPRPGGWHETPDGLIVPPGAGGSDDNYVPTAATGGTDANYVPTPATDDPIDPDANFDPDAESERPVGSRLRRGAVKVAKFAKKHPLAAFATLGVLTGVGIPAAAAVYVGGKFVKYATRGPVRIIKRIAGRAKQTGAYGRARDAMVSSQAALMLQQRYQEGSTPTIQRQPVDPADLAAAGPTEVYTDPTMPAGDQAIEPPAADGFEPDDYETYYEPYADPTMPAGDQAIEPPVADGFGGPPVAGPQVAPGSTPAGAAPVVGPPAGPAISGPGSPPIPAPAQPAPAQPAPQRPAPVVAPPAGPAISGAGSPPIPAPGGPTSTPAPPQPAPAQPPAQPAPAQPAPQPRPPASPQQPQPPVSPQPPAQPAPAQPAPQPRPPASPQQPQPPASPQPAAPPAPAQPQPPAPPAPQPTAPQPAAPPAPQPTAPQPAAPPAPRTPQPTAPQPAAPPAPPAPQPTAPQPAAPPAPRTPQRDRPGEPRDNRGSTTPPS